MTVGDTKSVDISETAGEYMVGTCGGETFSVAGDVAIGETHNVRVIDERDDLFIAVAPGAELRLRIDDKVDEKTVQANPSYGPIIIQSNLSVGTWWRCRVQEVHDEYVVAAATNKIPRNSSIPRGPLPEDPAQSLNGLLNPTKRE